MNKLKPFLFMLLSFISLLLAGCKNSNEPTAVATTVPEPVAGPTGALDSAVTAPEPTATPLATSTPQPTATLIPTDTPQPTATLTPLVIPDGYQLLDSPETGVRLFYPVGWFTLVELEDNAGLVSVASDAIMLDESHGLGNDAAEITVASDSRACGELITLFGSPEDSALALLTALVDNPRGLFSTSNLEIIQPPAVDPNSTDGREIASAEVQTTVTLVNNVFTYVYVIKTFVTDTRFGLFLGNVERENEGQFLAAIKMVGDSVFLSDPITREAQTVVSGDTIDGELTGEVPIRDYLYSATKGETLNLTVTTGTENLDLTLAIYPADDPCQPLVEEDTNFSGEGEILNYTFDSAGDYIIRVKDYSNEPGFFSLSVETDEVESASIGGVFEEQLSEAIPHRVFLHVAPKKYIPPIFTRVGRV
jgi:hypothetical protein